MDLRNMIPRLTTRSVGRSELGEGMVDELPITYGAKDQQFGIRRLRKARQILERRLDGVSGVLRTLIEDALKISAEQLQAQNGEPTRNQEILKQYRAIHAYFVAGPKRKQDSPDKQLKHRVYRELLLHLLNLMDLAESHHQPDSEELERWRFALSRHSQDLRKLAMVVRLGQPAKPPFYERKPEITGHFDDFELSVSEVEESTQH